MTIDEHVASELARIRPELTVHEWFTLREVIEKLIRRLLTEYENAPKNLGV